MRVSAKKKNREQVCLFNNETPLDPLFSHVFKDMITLSDDLSLNELLKTISKHYSYSYKEIIKEATALSQQVIGLLDVNKF